MIPAGEDTAGHQEQLTRQGWEEQGLAKKGQGVFCRPPPNSESFEAPISSSLPFPESKEKTLAKMISSLLTFLSQELDGRQALSSALCGHHLTPPSLG